MSSKFNKSKLPSRHITEGPKSASHRSFFYAMGFSRDAMNRPIIGVATAWNGTAPYNIMLRCQAGAAKAGAAKAGVEEAGGTPRESDCRSGVLWKYAATVGPAYKGAITHLGGVAETSSYADI